MKHILMFILLFCFVNMVIYNFNKKRHFVFACSVGALLCYFFSSLKSIGILETSIFIIVDVIFLCAIGYCIAIKEREREKSTSKFMKKMEESIAISMKEIKLLNSGEIPSDEDVELYYKMYLKKWELDHKDEWITDNIKPIDYDEWKRKGKVVDGYGGYKYMIPQTMDMMSGFPPNSTSYRFVDYRKLVEDEMK